MQRSYISLWRMLQEMLFSVPKQWNWGRDIKYLSNSYKENCYLEKLQSLRFPSFWPFSPFLAHPLKDLLIYMIHGLLKRDVLFKNTGIELMLREVLQEIWTIWLWWMFKAGTASLGVPAPNTRCIVASEHGETARAKVKVLFGPNVCSL